MQCPKCGAENPVGAANCNLCFYSFVERPPTTITAGEEASGKPGKTGFLTEEARSEVLKGGGAGVIGSLLFLTSLTIIHVSGVKVFDFLFSSLGVNKGNLSFFILLISMFALLCGGVGGNLDNKREIVPVIRSVAALAGLGIWAGLIVWLKPADIALIVWLTDGATGIILALASLPFAAMFLGLSESFGEDLEPSQALWGAIGGFLSGIVTAAVVAASYAITPVFGTAAPTGVLSVIGFSIKLAIITSFTGFIAGASLWLSIKSVKRFAS
ncbi:MAG: zinc ribbon domain-containing protein [Actinomycetota bacterium]